MKIIMSCSPKNRRLCPPHSVGEKKVLMRKFSVEEEWSLWIQIAFIRVISCKKESSGTRFNEATVPALGSASEPRANHQSADSGFDNNFKEEVLSPTSWKVRSWPRGLVSVSWPPHPVVKIHLFNDSRLVSPLCCRYPKSASQ